MLFRNQEPSSELEHPFELAVRTPLDSCSEGVLQYLPRQVAMRRVFGSPGGIRRSEIVYARFEPQR